MAMDQLPKTLFKEGTETQVEKVNNTCRTSILKKVEKYVEAEYKEVLADPLFSQVTDIYVHKFQYSGRVIHSFVSRDKVKTQNSYVIDGFSYALQIWLMEAIPDIGSLLGKKLKEGVTSMRCRNWKGSAKVSYEDIISIESDFASLGVVFPYISSTGNGNIIVDVGFERDDEMNDERVDLIIDMYRKKYDWSKHVWRYQETEQPYADSSEDDGSKEEEAGERSDCGMEEEIETAHVSPTKKRKNQYQDIGAESRKKKDLEEGMKSHIQGMFKSSFTALGLEVRDLIEDRVTQLEQTILSSQTPLGVPVYTHGAAPAYTQTHGAALTYTHTPAAATTSTQAPGSDSTVAPTPTPASTHASAPATTSRARASRNKASVPSHTGGPATAAKTRSQTKMFVILILFDTLDFNLGTQEHLQKTMDNLTQESHVKGFDPSQEIFNRPFLNDIDDPEVRCKDNDYELVFVPEDKFFKLTEWILKPKVLQIGPSKFDAELALRIMGPNEWLKNNDMDTILYLFREKTSLRRWKPNRVAFMNCMFSNQIITAYGKFDGNRRGNEIAMTSSSTSSARFPRISTHGMPTRCWCGEGITTFGSSTTENRRFGWSFDCGDSDGDAKHERVAQGITKFEERVMEKVKSEMVRVEHQTSEKLKEKVDLEIARVAHEMKHKLKIGIVAMVVVGAIVGIWTSLSV
uniref:DUF1985 domain-containing protein n=2 Tax=Brassica TaxID=3705 RepID=A0A0D3CR47_BRAOL